MTEIVINSSPYIYFDVYGATASTVSAVLKKDGISDIDLTTSLYTGQLPSTASERWQAQVPSSVTQQEGIFKVIWTASINSETIVKTDFFDIITPYTTP
ncbi:MAG TPA: hypothetical protein VFM18_20655, partial [Methanosarcina sp.]|nr:hypothetical protein [Methanosarcina sp.]